MNNFTQEQRKEAISKNYAEVAISRNNGCMQEAVAQLMKVNH